MTDTKLRAFEENLDRFGTKLDAWPAGLRADAESLLAISPEAAALWQRARHVTEALRAAPELEPSPQLLRRLAEVPVRSPRQSAGRWYWPFEGLFRPLAGLAFAALLGIATGIATPNDDAAPGEDVATTDDATATASSSDEEWDDMLALMVGGAADELDANGDEGEL